MGNGVGFVRLALISYSLGPVVHSLVRPVVVAPRQRLPALFGFCLPGGNQFPHLKAFAGVTLTIIKPAAGEEILPRLTPLSKWQEDILQRLGLGPSLYGQLEIQEIEN